MAGAGSDGYDISTLALDDDRYTVVQSLVRNRYEATDSRGNVVLRGKQKMLKMREEFPFVDADGNPAFTVKAGGIIDVAGNYAIVDEGTGEQVVVLDREWTLLADRWVVRDPDSGAVIAEIASRSKVVEALRHVPYVGVVFQLLPHEYDITDPEGERVGAIEGQFSLRDTYEVAVEPGSDVPREAVVAAAMVIDAIEAN